MSACVRLMSSELDAHSVWMSKGSTGLESGWRSEAGLERAKPPTSAPVVRSLV